MTIKNILNNIWETRNVLLEEFEYEFKRKPVDREELVKFTAKTIKEGNADEILEDILMPEDIEDNEELYKLTLLAAAIATEEQA